MKKSFLESEIGKMKSEDSFFHIIPAPLEKSVSYGGGTALAYDAIVEASQQLELYDGKSSPSELGIFCGTPVECETDVETVIHRIENAVSETFDIHAFPILVGGEHTVSLGAFRALAKRNVQCGIIQFDAHADLRETYDGTLYSHACVMRRAFEMGIPFLQIGVRSVSSEEHSFRTLHSLRGFDAAQTYDHVELPDDFPDEVYITVDVDAFDISIMPATGTPEPGGMGWYQFFDMVSSIASHKRIIGFDLVEYAPIDGMHAYDYFCARLMYNMMGIIQRSR